MSGSSLSPPQLEPLSLTLLLMLQLYSSFTPSCGTFFQDPRLRLTPSLSWCFWVQNVKIIWWPSSFWSRCEPSLELATLGSGVPVRATKEEEETRSCDLNISAPSIGPADRGCYMQISKLRFILAQVIFKLRHSYLNSPVLIVTGQN